MIKALIHQGDIRKAERYTPNNKGSKYLRQKLIELKEEIGKHTGIKTSTVLSQQFVE